MKRKSTIVAPTPGGTKKYKYYVENFEDAEKKLGKSASSHHISGANSGFEQY